MNHPISFGSVYNAKIDFANKKGSKIPEIGLIQQKIGGYTTYSGTDNPNIMMARITVPDRLDNKVEDYCKMNGIEYRKLDIKELVSPHELRTRMLLPQTCKQGKRVILKTDEFEKLLKSQTTGNFDHCKRMYNNYYKEDTMKQLRSGSEFRGIHLHIEPMMVDSVKDYVDKFGKDRLNKDSLAVDFVQSDSFPNHCLYFAFKDLGMTEIPAFVTEQTKEICEALGLIKQGS